MEKFDGYLIASDIDGTFKGRGSEAKAITAENFRAAQYFIANGGRFTFISGRSVSFLPEMGYLPIINAPACLYNGALIYDYQTEQTLKDVRLGFRLQDFLEAIDEKKALVQTVRIYPDLMGEPLVLWDDFILPKVADQPTPKLICTFETPEKAAEFRSFASGLPFLKDSYISQSWPVGVEINAADATKGHALQFIKEYLGDIHTAIGIGDYENDLKLLEMADIGVAVGDGMQILKDAADWVVKPNEECAVRDLIERLEDKIDRGIMR